MRIVLSRKGFDSTAGGAPSPIIDGRPVPLPIPEKPACPTTYDALGLGEIVEQVTRGRIGRHANCHDDPMFADGHCWFGQSGSAQGHLGRNGVGAGDVFLFFGLFADPATGERHHRIFGYLRIACRGAPEAVRRAPAWRDPPRRHPHFIGRWPANNTLYFGPGRTAANASPALRLTVSGGPLNRWKVPAWMGRFGLSYHARAERWIDASELDSVRRGQEFVCDTGDETEARLWLDKIIAELEGSSTMILD